MVGHYEIAHEYKRYYDKSGERDIQTYTHVLFPDHTNPAYGVGFSDIIDTLGTFILDLGTGAGNLARDQRILGWRSTTVGIDLFGKGSHGDNSIFGDSSQGIPSSPDGVIANWLTLPFPNESFDHILAYESFPRYYNLGDTYDVERYEDELVRGLSDREYQKRSFTEITRVARRGCIWRGTLPRPMIKKRHSDPLFKDFSDHGWGFVIMKGIFIARKI